MSKQISPRSQNHNQSYYNQLMQGQHYEGLSHLNTPEIVSKLENRHIKVPQSN